MGVLDGSLELAEHVDRRAAVVRLLDAVLRAVALVHRQALGPEVEAVLFARQERVRLLDGRDQDLA